MQCWGTFASLEEVALLLNRCVNIPARDLRGGGGVLSMWAFFWKLHLSSIVPLHTGSCPAPEKQHVTWKHPTERRPFRSALVSSITLFLRVERPFLLHTRPQLLSICCPACVLRLHMFTRVWTLEFNASFKSWRKWEWSILFFSQLKRLNHLLCVNTGYSGWYGEGALLGGVCVSAGRTHI